MSCRVMGKKVEEALLGYTVERARAAGAEHIVAPPADGPRNQPAKGFFAGKFASAESASIDTDACYHSATDQPERGKLRADIGFLKKLWMN